MVQIRKAKQFSPVHVDFQVRDRIWGKRFYYNKDQVLTKPKSYFFALATIFDT